MGSLTVCEREPGIQVLSENFRLVILDVLEECRVNSFLGIESGLGNLLLLEFVGGEELLFLGLFGSFLSLEEGVLNLGSINSLKVNLSGGSDDILLVYALKRDAVDLVGSSHEEESRLELLESNDSLSSESSGEKNDNSSGDDA
eukprot:CAMPEP_0205804984 /NCGR_PEP_ID=MMETSP0205-20121125/8042_1 /ASSEMBLY_ACC=CAM_ASM_000278 /TAXON_ID=36767 /ORGANISM="Euplotes focardii, Strain TN1" /LENGTH=143 /DNA_ID=CAMNT_0053075417 /DNA_START=24 /DNA_END=455 /DNA_ORIENTATION=+